jgi:hypothetical protein
MALTIYNSHSLVTDCETNGAGWTDSSPAYVVTFNATTNVVNLTAHPYRNGDIVRFFLFGGTLPPELAAGTSYEVVTATANTFQVRLNAFFAIIDFTTAGTATVFVQAYRVSSFNTDIYFQGTACRARYARNETNARMIYDYGSNINLGNDPYFGESSGLGMWIWCTQPNLLETLAAGGIQVSIGTTTANYNLYKVLGRDNYPPRGSWVRVWVAVNAPSSQVGAGLTITQARYFGIQYSIGAVVGTGENIGIDQMHCSRAALGTDTLNMGGGSTGARETIDAAVLADGANTRGLGNKFGTVITMGGAYGINAPLSFGSVTNPCFLEVKNKAIIFQDQPFPNMQFDLNNALSGYVFDGCQLGTVAPGQGLFGTQGASGPYGAIFRNCLIQNLAAITIASANTSYLGTVFDNTPVVTISGILNGSSFINCSALSALGWGYLSIPMPDLLGLADNLTFIMGSANSHAIAIDSGAPLSVTLSGHSYTGYAPNDGSVGNEVIYNNTLRNQEFVLTNGTPVPSIRDIGISTHTIINNRTWTISVVDTAGAAVAGAAEITVTTTADPPVVLFSTDTVHAGAPSPSGTESYVFPFANAGNDVIILVLALGYEAYSLTTVLPSGDSTLVVQLQTDRNYNNPV